MNTPKALTSQQTKQPQLNRTPAQKVRPKPRKKIIEIITQNTTKVGQVNSDPQQEEERLQNIAQNLSAENLAFLKEISLNQKENPDARFLAVYLLSKSHKDGALSHLASIAREPLIKDEKRQRHFDFERTLRAQAIEGFASIPNKRKTKQELLITINKLNNKFLIDRAQRTLHQLNGGKSPKEQDKVALKNLLRNISK